ncbi:MAG: hypothetical protein M3Y56_11250 [Armatimonadota bacterium]|nr:hypothetical protein [Armatimonadota bacterium]
MNSNSLWPIDLVPDSDPDVPLSILRQQADLLGEKTGGQVIADVEMGSIMTGVMLDFVLLAPSLQNYRYRLFKVIHPLENYPLDLILLSGEVLHPDTADEFRDELRSIFASDATRRAIGELMAYSAEQEFRRSA